MRWTRLLLLIGLVVALSSLTQEVAASCSVYLACDDGSTVRCSCSGGGTCSSYPNGNSWGGYVVCSCDGKGTVQYSCNAPTCTQTSCDTQCGGPGSGVCSGNTCYCL